MLEYAARALAEIDSLQAVAADLNQDNRGTLSIATTHTQARYVLPPVVQAFRERYPEVELHLHQGTSEQIAEMVAADRVQLAIATGSDGLFPGPGAAAGVSLASPGDRAASTTRWRAVREARRSRNWPTTRWSPTCSAFPAPPRCRRCSRARA